MKLQIANYLQQSVGWPGSGRHILAQYDDESIVVYQAYRPDIGHFAALHGYFGGNFSFNRMSWIKPNFLWMMYRSGWGSKDNQEVTLATRLKRGFFDGLLAEAVPSSYSSHCYASREEWQAMVASSNVRLQWDPDHDPQGRPLDRRAIQLGLRGHVLAHFGREAIVAIEDISEFVSVQREIMLSGKFELLQTPAETVYRPGGIAVAARVGLDD